MTNVSKICVMPKYLAKLFAIRIKSGRIFHIFSSDDIFFFLFLTDCRIKWRFIGEILDRQMGRNFILNAAHKSDIFFSFCCCNIVQWMQCLLFISKKYELTHNVSHWAVVVTASPSPSIKHQTDIIFDCGFKSKVNEIYTKHIHFQTRTKDIRSKKASETEQPAKRTFQFLAVARNHVECTFQICSMCYVSSEDHPRNRYNVFAYVCELTKETQLQTTHLYVSIFGTCHSGMDSYRHAAMLQNVSLGARSWVEIWATCFIALHSMAVNTIKYVLFCIQEPVFL